MKKILSLVIVLAMVAGNANAFEFQYESESGLSFMGLFGMNVSKLQNSGLDAKVGAMMGARADYMLPGGRGTYVTAGVDWTMKGGKVSAEYLGLNGQDYSATAKCPLHYFEIPVRVGFRYNFMEDLGVYGELGPYFAVGVGGKNRMSIDGDGEEINELEDMLTYKAFKKTSDIEKINNYQRWDAGIGFRVGVEYNNHYNLMFGCDWGLADIYRDSFRDTYHDSFKAQGIDASLPKVKNFNFSITLGYRF